MLYSVKSLGESTKETPRILQRGEDPGARGGSWLTQAFLTHGLIQEGKHGQIGVYSLYLPAASSPPRRRLLIYHRLRDLRPLRHLGALLNLQRNYPIDTSNSKKRGGGRWHSRNPHR